MPDYDPKTYNPFQNPGPSPLNAPFFNPYTGVQHDFRDYTVINHEPGYADSTHCEEGNVYDTEMKQCVPIEVAVEAVERGDRSKHSFAPVGDGKGGFISFADMFDGGGAGWRGRNFEGGIGDLGMTGALVQKGLNYVTDPYGSRARGWDKPVQALSDFTNEELVEKGYAKPEEIYKSDPVATAHYKDAESGSARIRDSDDNERVVRTYNTQAVLDKGNKDKHGNTVVKGKNMGGLIYRQGGGGVPMPMVAEPQKKSFMELVADTKSRIEGRKEQEVMPLVTPMGGYDAQGQGPIYGDFQPGVQEVGPDMGADTVDAKLTPGEFVMNAEATQMYGPEIEQMNQDGLAMRNMGGLIYRQEGGDVPAPTFGQQLHEGLSNPATGRVGEFIYRSSMNDPDAISSLRGPEPDKSEQNRLRAEEQELKDIRNLAEKAVQAQKLMPVAASAGAESGPSALDIFRKSSKVSGILDQLGLSSGLGAVDKAAQVATVAAADPKTLEFLIQEQSDTALGDAVSTGKITSAQSSAMRDIISIATDITAIALRAQGSGPKTDFDFLVAERSVANLRDDPNTIINSFQRLIDDANKTLEEAGVDPVASEAITVAAPIVSTSDKPIVDVNKVADTTKEVVDATKDLAGDAATAAGDAVDAATSTVKSWRERAKNLNIGG